MAKEKEPKYDRGGKIRVVVFELEGSNETLQESLRTVANALGKTVSVNRAFASIQDSQKVNSLPESSDDSDDLELDPETENTIIDVPVKNKRTSGKRKPAKTPEIVEIDLKKPGAISFEDFATQKNPSNDIAKYLVIMYWLKTHLDISEITTSHTYTCYKHMGWKTPTDPGAPLRNAKGFSYINSGSAKGYYVINHIGENYINKMTGS
jgi:hypothetical protein